MAKPYNNKPYRESEVDKLIKELGKCNTLKEVLNPAKYALEDGYAYKIAAELLRNKDTTNSNQMRKIFGELKSIEKSLINTKSESQEEDIKIKLIPILPNIAYAVGRGVVNSGFYYLIKTCIDKIDGKEDFQEFIRFYEALIAYSKFISETKRYKGGKR